MEPQRRKGDQEEPEEFTTKDTKNTKRVRNQSTARHRESGTGINLKDAKEAKRNRRGTTGGHG
jgi:hypothetical protein